MTWRIVEGDAWSELSKLESGSVAMVCTSPPYFQARSYGAGPDEIGREPTVEAYVEKLRAVFAEARRVLRDDGTLWLNLGFSYAGSGKGVWTLRSLGTEYGRRLPKESYVPEAGDIPLAGRHVPGYPDKTCIPIPWLVTIALIQDGWIFRAPIVWHKPNAMPRPEKDRPVLDWEQVLLFSKRPTYAYYPDAVRQNGRLGRSVWSINSVGTDLPFYAVMPPALAERCILAGSQEGDTVLDMFAGIGTVPLVADRLGRHGIGIELNPETVNLAKLRLRDDAPLFNQEAVG